MSQAGGNNSGGGGPTVPTQFTTDFQADQTTPNGKAIPSGNNLNVLGGSGISTYVDPNNGDNLFIKVKNSTTNIGQTIDNQTITLSTIDCSTAGTYFFTTQVAAYDVAGVEAAGGSLYTTVRSTGGVVTVIDDTDAIAHRTSNLTAIDYQIIASGTNAIFQVTGQTGYTLDWGAITIYVYRG
jgi:hypothetical protein